MATAILKYDARNANAKKTLDYILSLGFFEKIDNTGLKAPETKNALTKDFEIACKQLQQSRQRKTKRKSLDELLNEK